MCRCSGRSLTLGSSAGPNRPVRDSLPRDAVGTLGSGGWSRPPTGGRCSHPPLTGAAAGSAPARARVAHGDVLAALVPQVEQVDLLEELRPGRVAVVARVLGGLVADPLADGAHPGEAVVA